MHARPIRHPLQLALLCATLFSIAAFAQSDRDLSERLLACDALQNAQDRLACFNRLVDGIKAPPAELVRPRNGTSATTDVPSQTSPAPPSEPADPLPAPAPAVDAGPSSAASEPERAATAAAPRAQPQPTPAGSTQAPASAEASAAPEAPVREEPSPRPAGLTGEAVIVRVWENYDGRFTVELDNGNVWRETQGTRVGIPEVGAKVEVTRSLFGAYRMKIDGIPRIAWIRQTD